MVEGPLSDTMDARVLQFRQTWLLLHVVKAHLSIFFSISQPALLILSDEKRDTDMLLKSLFISPAGLQATQ